MSKPIVRELLEKTDFGFKKFGSAGFRYELLAAPVVLPNDATSLISPATNCGWLNRFWKLAPNSKFTRSVMPNRLITLRSTLSIGGTWTELRPAVARAPI